VVTVNRTVSVPVTRKLYSLMDPLTVGAENGKVSESLARCRNTTPAGVISPLHLPSLAMRLNDSAGGGAAAAAAAAESDIASSFGAHATITVTAVRNAAILKAGPLRIGFSKVLVWGFSGHGRRVPAATKLHC
jgi:hypothetical protein